MCARSFGGSQGKTNKMSGIHRPEPKQAKADIGNENEGLTAAISNGGIAVGMTRTAIGIDLPSRISTPPPKQVLRKEQRIFENCIDETCSNR